jgi:hypothetical protein
MDASGPLGSWSDDFNEVERLAGVKETNCIYNSFLGEEERKRANCHLAGEGRVHWTS